MSKSLSISTDYTPPFQLADDILSLVVEIAEVVGHLSAHLEERVPTPQL